MVEIWAWMGSLKEMFYLFFLSTKKRYQDFFGVSAKKKKRITNIKLHEKSMQCNYILEYLNLKVLHRLILCRPIVTV